MILRHVALAKIGAYPIPQLYPAAAGLAAQ